MSRVYSELSISAEVFAKKPAKFIKMKKCHIFHGTEFKL